MMFTQKLDRNWTNRTIGFSKAYAFFELMREWGMNGAPKEQKGPTFPAQGKRLTRGAKEPTHV